MIELVDPADRATPLTRTGDALMSPSGRRYPIVEGVADFTAVDDPGQALLELRDARVDATDVSGRAACRRASLPEQRAAAELVELLERAADLLEEVVLPALGRDGLELAVDLAQLELQAVELLAHFGVLGEERL